MEVVCVIGEVNSQQSNDNPDRGIQVGVAKFLHSRGQSGTEEGVLHIWVVTGRVDLCNL